MDPIQLSNLIYPPGPTWRMPVQATIPGHPDASVEVEMIMDTGADVSCIPFSKIRELERQLGRLLPYSIIPTEDFNGQESVERRYYLITTPGQFGNGQGFEFLALRDEDQFGLIGRDILKLHRLDYNGPENEWSFDT